MVAKENIHKYSGESQIVLIILKKGGEFFMGNIENGADIFFSPTGSGGSEGKREAEGAEKDKKAEEIKDLNKTIKQNEAWKEFMKTDKPEKKKN